MFLKPALHLPPTLHAFVQDDFAHEEVGSIPAQPCSRPGLWLALTGGMW